MKKYVINNHYDIKNSKFPSFWSVTSSHKAFAGADEDHDSQLYHERH